MRKYPYGQRPPDIKKDEFALGWLAGVRHLKPFSARESFWHSHKEIQLLYCIKGEISYEIADRPSVVVTAGHYIVIPPGLSHRHQLAIDPAGHRIEILLEPPSDTAPRGLIPQDVVTEALDTLLGQPCAAVPVPRELDALFQELDALAARGGPNLAPAELALARTLGTLILLRCTDTRRATTSKKTDGRLMDEAVIWLEKHASEPVRMSRLVAYMGYSRSRLFDLFRRHTGLSPADYLARYRIRRARELLARTDGKIADVARECGFAGCEYFNAVFKRQTGFTPSAWRHKARTEPNP